MFKSLWLKLAGVMAAISGLLLMLLKSEKSKRKAAEFEASTEKANREHLEKRDDMISNIDEERETWQEAQFEEAIYTAKKTEELKHEKDDRVVTDSLIGMLGKGRNKTKID